MSPFRFALAALVPLALTACGVPDIIAHGVKSIERNQDANRTAANTAPAAVQPAPKPVQAAPQRATGAEADYVPAAAPQREQIMSEPLR